VPTFNSAVVRLFALIAALLVAGTALAQEAPDQLVRMVTLEVVGLITKDKEIQAGNTRKVIELVDAKVLPHFNFASMTALAVGQNWGKATPEQKKRLSEEFRTLLVRTYASALAAFSDQKFDFRPLRSKPTDTDVTVQVRIVQQGAQAVSLDYGMEKTASGWKVYDVMVGGISLVANYRSEFNNQIRDSGIDGLINNLQAKNRGLERASAERK
jgi:phospholipid transport system substrate-binding protein